MLRTVEIGAVQSVYTSESQISHFLHNWNIRHLYCVTPFEAVERAPCVFF